MITDWGRSQRVAIAGFLVAVFVVSGCGNETARSAEAEADTEVVSAEVVVDDAAADDTAEDAAADTADDGKPEEPPSTPDQNLETGGPIDRLTSGGNKGSRICVRNEAGEPNGIVVEFTKADTSNGGTLRAAGDDQERCAEGTFFTGNDVIGKLYLPTFGSKTYEFSATNPWFGLPSANLKQSSVNARYCIAGEFDERTGSTFDDGLYAITLQRLVDSNWKEFKVTIRNSSQPASSGVAKECPVSPQPAVAS